MNAIQYIAFQDELKKIAQAIEKSAAQFAGVQTKKGFGLKGVGTAKPGKRFAGVQVPAIQGSGFDDYDWTGTKLKKPTTTAWTEANPTTSVSGT